MKKMLSLFVIIMLIGTMSMSAFANEEDDILCTGAEMIYGNLELRDPTAEEKEMIELRKIDEIEVDDLKEFISELPHGEIDVSDRLVEGTPKIRLIGKSDIASRYIGVHPIPAPPVKINCQFTYKTKKNSQGKYYFTSVSNIKSWLSGLQIPVSYTWTPKSTSKHFSNGKKNVRITVNGVIGMHVLIKGIGKVLDQNMSYSFDFIARK